MSFYPHKKLTLCFIMALLTTLQGCALQLLNMATPPSGYTRLQDISYGNEARQRLDIYEPYTAQQNTENSHEPAAQKSSQSDRHNYNNNHSNDSNDSSYDKNTTLIFFYGGAWDSGDKDLYRFVGRAFALEGYRVVIPDYRIYPEVQFPDFVKDSALAVKKVSTLYPDQNLILIGHSAGAHIAALLATDHRYIQEANVDLEKIRAWVGWSGPYNFLPLTSPKVKRIFSHTNNLEMTQPIHFVDSTTPPALLTHGNEDTRVLIKNSKTMAKKLREFNIAVTEKYYEKNSHSDTLVSASTLLRKRSPSFKDTIQYIDSLTDKISGIPTKK